MTLAPVEEDVPTVEMRLLEDSTAPEDGGSSGTASAVEGGGSPGRGLGAVEDGITRTYLGLPG